MPRDYDSFNPDQSILPHWYANADQQLIKYNYYQIMYNILCFNCSIYFLFYEIY